MLCPRGEFDQIALGDESVGHNFYSDHFSNVWWIHLLPSERKVSLNRPFAPKMPDKGLKLAKLPCLADSYPMPYPHPRCATGIS